MDWDKKNDEVFIISFSDSLPNLGTKFHQVDFVKINSTDIMIPKCGFLWKLRKAKKKKNYYYIDFP